MLTLLQLRGKNVSMPPDLDKPAKRKSSRAADTTEQRASRIDLHVADRLRLRREELGLSPQDFARRIGLTSGAIKKYESGALPITAGRLLVLAEALGCEPDYFFAEFEERPAKLD
jgi:ribosome-binding protein aMBF1 (putative translation factor)